MKLSLALALSGASTAAAADCKATTLDFLVLDGDATFAAIEDDIRANLAEVGITATARFLDRDAYNTDMVAGNFDVVFSQTWGAPYDPHSYVASWTTPDEAHYGDKWTALLSSVHDEVIHVPLWGLRIPSVVNKQRLMGYTSGYQQFDYPVHKMTVVSGEKIVTVAPGAQTGLFTSVGRLDPHSYRPNEFFANNWVYEGLVAYGANGNIEASLATAWTSEETSSGGETWRFTLREGVTFHDGAAFDCSVVKLNFDHVFAGGLSGGDWHGWYGLPGAASSWSCDGEVFVLNTDAPYYPLLQELSYIRPLRMLSPLAFVNGAATDPYTHNSCPTGWGTANADTDEEYDERAQFLQHADYWGGAPDIEELHVVYYADQDAVLAALQDESLDVVVGAGVIAASEYATLQYDDKFDVLHGISTQNNVLIMNIADVDVRKTVVHAVNKGPIIEAELGGFESPTDSLFNPLLPYCDIDLTPKFDYDLEKARLLNCPEVETVVETVTEGGSSKKKSSDDDEALYGGLAAAFAVALLLAVLFVAYMGCKERAGEPVFAPLKNPIREGDLR
ncbi:bacterial extracellular solute-binding protein [Aureococcus anophagefferens]|nr:bacterial extracellular solute-binding protein [Aureococcus anophagefferens]